MSFHQNYIRFFTHKVPNLVLRYLVAAIGIFLTAFTAALMRKTGLGTSAISSIPCALSFAFPPLTMGQYTFIFNAVLFIAELALLRRNFEPIQFLQLPATLVFSAFIDLGVALCEPLVIDSYFAAWCWTLVAVLLMGLGIYLEVKPQVILLPGEGIVKTITQVAHGDFPRFKVYNDVSCVLIASLISVIRLGGLYGVREGTVFTAVFVGIVIGFYRRILRFSDKWLPVPRGKAQTL